MGRDMMSINVSDVIKSFNGNTILKSVSFTQEKGKVFSIIGPSGSGTVSYTHLTLPTTSRRQRQMCIRDSHWTERIRKDNTVALLEFP